MELLETYRAEPTLEPSRALSWPGKTNEYVENKLDRRDHVGKIY